MANLPHLVMAVFVIAAGTILAALHVITGGEAIGLIAAAGGFSLGAGAGSASASVAATTASVTSNSNGGLSATVHPAVTATTPPPTPAV